MATLKEMKNFIKLHNLESLVNCFVGNGTEKEINWATEFIYDRHTMTDGQFENKYYPVAHYVLSHCSSDK